jgi:hypothetical protein
MLIAQRLVQEPAQAGLPPKVAIISRGFNRRANGAKGERARHA